MNSERNLVSVAESVLTVVDRSNHMSVGDILRLNVDEIIRTINRGGDSKIGLQLKLE